MNNPSHPILPHQLLAEFRDQHGTSIQDHSFAAPFLVILLRHIGCPFCRKTLQELSDSLHLIADCGYRVGIVHMDDEADMAAPLKRYSLENLPRFHDPDKRLYQALHLPRMSFRALGRMGMWKQGISDSLAHGGSFPKADPMQLPGAFLIDQGVVLAGEPVLSPEDSPDFLALLIRSEAVA